MHSLTLYTHSIESKAISLSPISKITVNLNCPDVDKLIVQHSMFSKCYDCWTLPRPLTRSHTSYLPASCDTTALVEMSCNGWPAFSATGASKFLSKANTLHLPLSRQAYHRVVFWDICYSLSSSTTCQRRPALHAVCLLMTVFCTRE